METWAADRQASLGLGGALGGRVIKVQRNITGVQTDDVNAGHNLLLYVDDLADIDLARIDKIRAIFCLRRGHNSHTEVACRIKGIPIIQVDNLAFDEGVEKDIFLEEEIQAGAVDTYRSFPHKFQASVYDPSDLVGLNFARIETIFVRMEHVLYPMVARVDDLHPQNKEVGSRVQSTIEEYLSACPEHVQVVFRGVDVRSDDVLLGPTFHSGGAESNPELGNHGTRYLLEHREWVELIASAIRRTESGRVVYAAPFISSYDIFNKFRLEYDDLFGDSSIVPFVETPAIFGDYPCYGDIRRVCVGLKDIVQFYFAADRSRSRWLSFDSYLDGGLMRLMRDVVAYFSAADVHISIYQSWDLLETYTNALRGSAWIPSMSAYELRVLESMAS